jgi:hypothetical protein
MKVRAMACTKSVSGEVVWSHHDDKQRVYYSIAPEVLGRYTVHVTNRAQRRLFSCLLTASVWVFFARAGWEEGVVAQRSSSSWTLKAAPQQGLDLFTCLCSLADGETAS